MGGLLPEVKYPASHVQLGAFEAKGGQTTTWQDPLKKEGAMEVAIMLPPNPLLHKQPPAPATPPLAM